MKKIDRDIYEYGEVERDAARTAQFFKVGGFWYRLLKWVERMAEGERKALIEERDEEREIDRLRRELFVKETEAMGYLRAVGKMQAENARLRKALEPFADFIEGTHDSWADERRIGSLDYDFDKLKLGLFRAARAALTTKEGSTDG